MKSWRHFLVTGDWPLVMSTGMGRGLGWTRGAVLEVLNGVGLCKFCSEVVLFPASPFPRYGNFPKILLIFLEELFGGPERRGKGESAVESGRVAGKWQSQSVCTVNLSKAVRGGRKKVNSYLPGRGDTMIKKVVLPGRGSPIALRVCWSLRFPQIGETRLRNLW